MHLRLRSISPETTEALGAAMAEVLPVPWVVALDGDLGSGKTTFVRGMARGLGLVAAEIASPTYVLCTRHDGEDVSLAHLDAYRVEHETALESVGFDEMLRERSLGTVIEWASKIDGALPTERVEVRLAHRGPTDRAIEIFDRRNDGQGRARLLDALVTLFGAVEVAPAASQCPSCGKDESSPDHRPFCSARCRLADLGKWLNGTYVFSRPLHADEELSD